MTFVYFLPDLLCQTFSFLSIKELACGEKVCSNWNQALTSPSKKKLLLPVSWIKLSGPYFYFKKAKEGNACAQAQLALCYYYGYGTRPNKKKVIEWAKRSFEQGHPDGIALWLESPNPNPKKRKSKALFIISSS